MRLVILGLWLAAVCLVGSAPAADKDEGGSISDDKVVAWVKEKVKERLPTPQERRFDEVGWATELRTAIDLGKKHQRPIFLFTMDGRINTGRC